jgi:hypothetical protein
VAGAGGWQSLLKHYEEGKMTILEDLNLTIDQKKKVEDKLELAHEKTRKMEESLKNIDEAKKKIENESMNWSCTSPILLNYSKKYYSY